MPHPCSLVVLSNESVVQFQDVLLIVELEVQSYEESVLDELSEITVSFTVTFMHQFITPCLCYRR